MLRRIAAALGLAAILLVTGCSSTVHLPPAGDAENPACAEVSVRFPAAMGDLDRRWTDAQATAAYGDPTTVIVSCGVDVPGPTSTLQCVTLENVDWLVDPAESPWLRMTTYGRNPAVQVFVDSTAVSPDSVLSNSSLVGAVRTVAAEHECTAPDELPDDLTEVP